MESDQANEATRRTSALIITAVFVVLLGAALVWAGLVKSAEEIRGRTIDADTGALLPGVVVVAIWELRGVEGVHVDNLVVQETVTNEQGEFRISRWGPRINGRFLYAGLPANAPQLILFRDDYEPLLLDNNFAESRLGMFVKTGGLQDTDHRLRRWTASDSARVDYGQQIDAEIRYILTGPDCEWRQIPALLMELHELGQNTIDVGGRSLMLDRIPDNNCGNAETYIREYLR